MDVLSSDDILIAIRRILSMLSGSQPSHTKRDEHFMI